MRSIEWRNEQTPENVKVLKLYVDGNSLQIGWTRGILADVAAIHGIDVVTEMTTAIEVVLQDTNLSQEEIQEALKQLKTKDLV